MADDQLSPSVERGELHQTLVGGRLTRATLRQLRLIAPPLVLFELLPVGFLLAGMHFQSSEWAIFFLGPALMATAGFFGLRRWLKRYELFLSNDRARARMGFLPEVAISRAEVTGVLDRPGDWLVLRAGTRSVPISYFLPAFDSVRERVLGWCPPDKVVRRRALYDLILPVVAMLGGFVAVFVTDNGWIVVPISAGLILAMGVMLRSAFRSPSLARKIKIRMAVQFGGLAILLFFRLSFVVAKLR